jgi:predicted transcriptional regulator
MSAPVPLGRHSLLTQPHISLSLENQIWETKFRSPAQRRGIQERIPGGTTVSRPRARELTERELEVMHIFWSVGEATAQTVRDRLSAAGLNRNYTTIANLVRLLHEKGFLEQTTADRPFHYRPQRTFEEVSRGLLGDLLQRVFRGSREQLLVRLMEQNKLSARERTILENILKERES